MVLVFLLLLHSYFHCCPNLSSYLRSRNHQMQMQDADTRLFQISVTAKVLHRLHFHSHLQCPSFKPRGPSMPKWHQNGANKTKLGWAHASSHYTTAQPTMWMQLQHLQGTNPSGISHNSSPCAKRKTSFLPFILQRHNHKAYLDALQKRTGCAPRHLTQKSSEGTAGQDTESWRLLPRMLLIFKMCTLKRNVLSSNGLGYAQHICVPKSLSPKSEYFQCCSWACVLWMHPTERDSLFFIKWVNSSPPERLLSYRVIKLSDFQVNAQWTKGCSTFTYLNSARSINTQAVETIFTIHN